MTDGDAVEVAVIGGGPAGYSAALRCAEHGLATVLIERDTIGGTCLNVGCIPSKALIHAADTHHSLADGSAMATMGIAVDGRAIDLAATMRWKDDIVGRLREGVAGQLARGGIRVVHGDAEVIDARTIRTTSAEATTTLTVQALVLATGSRATELPDLPFGGRVLSSTDVLQLDHVPGRVVVVGGGYIGVELGTALAKLGSGVTVIEAAGQLLPHFDAALVRPVVRHLARLDVGVHTETTVVGVDDDSVEVEHRDGRRERLGADVVLVTVGRRPVTEGLGLERLGLEMNGAAIAVDDRCRTSARGVYAIGDVTGEPMLAHRGIAQAELVADVVAGTDRAWDQRAIPAVCFTDPEICSVGLSPHDPELAGRGERVVVGQTPFGANGRALALGAADGFVRVVADATDGALLGLQAVGPNVAELAAVGSVAVELGTTLDDLAATVVAHPTLAETFREAVLAAAHRRADHTWNHLEASGYGREPSRSGR